MWHAVVVHRSVEMWQTCVKVCHFQCIQPVGAFGAGLRRCIGLIGSCQSQSDFGVSWRYVFDDVNMSSLSGKHPFSFLECSPSEHFRGGHDWLPTVKLCDRYLPCFEAFSFVAFLEKLTQNGRWALIQYYCLFSLIAFVWSLVMNDYDRLIYDAQCIV